MGARYVLQISRLSSKMPSMSNTYKFVPAPDDYPGKIYACGNRVLEHHLVWWQRTGSLVPAGHVLHHKNGKKYDNRFENLELMAAGAHTDRHNRKHDEIVFVNCAWCGKAVQRSGRDVAFKRSRGQKNFFCSGAHAAKYGHANRTPRKKKVRHGTKTAYSRHRCRCDACREANRKSQAKWRARNKR